MNLGMKLPLPRNGTIKYKKKITLNLYIHIYEHTHIEEHVKKKI